MEAAVIVAEYRKTKRTAYEKWTNLNYALIMESVNGRAAWSLQKVLGGTNKVMEA